MEKYISIHTKSAPRPAKLTGRCARPPTAFLCSGRALGRLSRPDRHHKWSSRRRAAAGGCLSQVTGRPRVERRAARTRRAAAAAAARPSDPVRCGAGRLTVPRRAADSPPAQMAAVVKRGQWDGGYDVARELHRRLVADCPWHSDSHTFKRRLVGLK